MATRYDSFSVFMAEVTEKTKNRMITNGEILGYITAVLIQGGWVVFLSLCALLALGPFAFGVALVTAATTPFGLILGVVCAGGSGAALWAMYNNRDLPLGVKEIGNRYKNKYEALFYNANSHDEIDRLLDQASDELYRRLTR